MGKKGRKGEEAKEEEERKERKEGRGCDSGKGRRRKKVVAMGRTE